MEKAKSIAKPTYLTDDEIRRLVGRNFIDSGRDRIQTISVAFDWDNSNVEPHIVFCYVRTPARKYHMSVSLFNKTFEPV